MDIASTFFWESFQHVFVRISKALLWNFFSKSFGKLFGNWFEILFDNSSAFSKRIPLTICMLFSTAIWYHNSPEVYFLFSKISVEVFLEIILKYSSEIIPKILGNCFSILCEIFRPFLWKLCRQLHLKFRNFLLKLMNEFAKKFFEGKGISTELLE